MPATRPRTRAAAAASFAAALALALSIVPAGASVPADRPEPASQAAEAESGQPSTAEADDHANLHPSGRDRSVEPGGSGEQGRAGADPDDDGRGPDRSNGGLDQPGGEGGVYEHDRDGNNGCGNDDDFEDDNEGLCLGRDGAPGQEREVEDAEEGQDVEETPRQESPVLSEVEDQEVERPAPAAEELPEPAGTAVLGDEVTAEPEVEVLGVSVTRDVTPAAAQAADTSVRGELPRTGAGLAMVAGMGALALAAGVAMVRAGRADAI